MKTKIFSLIILVFSIFQIPAVGAQGSGNISGAKHIITAEHPLAEGCIPARQPTEEEKKSQQEVIAQNLGYIPVKITDFKHIPVPERRYICDAPQGTEGFMRGIAKIVRWVMMISMLLGVLAVAALGIVWAISGGDDVEQQRKLKEWFIGLVVGLTILFFFQPILLWIAPWIYK